MDSCPTLINEMRAQEMAGLFRSLSDPTRLRILSTLLGEERSVQEIAECLGMSHSAISHQLSSLRQMRILKAHKRGRQVFYTLDDQHVSDLFMRGLDHISHT